MTPMAAGQRNDVPVSPFCAFISAIRIIRGLISEGTDASHDPDSAEV
jgi:hypothetical protein